MKYPGFVKAQMKITEFASSSTLIWIFRVVFKDQTIYI